MTVTDNGTVTGLTRIDPKSAGTAYLFVAPFILNPADDNYMYLAYGSTIYRNDSLSYIPITGNEYNGITQGWKTLANAGTAGQLNPPYVSTLKFSEADPDLLFFGTNAGQVYKIDSVRTSVNGTRVNITGSNFPAGAYVSSVEPDRLNPNNIIVTFSNYEVISIFYTTDGGQTWADVSGNLEQNPDGSGDGPSVNWGTIYNDGTTKKYYVGTSIGLFSTDTLNGLNTVWVQEGPNTIGNVVIDMITARAYDGNIVVGTHGNGVYSNQVFTPSAVSTVAPAPLHITAYPNPFNSNIIISLNGAAKGPIEADVYDLNGRLIRKLSDPNTTQLTWDGRDYTNTPCATATYLIKVTTAGKSSFTKVVKVN